jgi:MoxR-like ATPase
MEEEQVTVDGDSRKLPDPFTVIATQNTVEGDRAYDLPMAEVDRFMMKLELGYPDHDEETALLDRASGRHPIEELDPVATPADVRRARSAVDELTVSVHIREYVTRLASYTREQAELGVSPRGAIALLEAAKARALLESREYVIPDDVQREAPVVLPHRIRVGGERRGTELVDDALESVPVE